MQIQSPTVWLLALLAVAFGPRLLASSPAAPPAERLVSASIEVDGKVVLRASTSDDGHPDADAVWGYLRAGLEFRPTEDFGSLGVAPEALEVELGWLKSRANAHLGDPPKLAVDVAYGGYDEPYQLKLVRASGAETWRVSPETAERRFPYRRITRAQAAALEQPKRRR